MMMSPPVQMNYYPPMRVDYSRGSHMAGFGRNLMQQKSDLYPNSSRPAYMKPRIQSDDIIESNSVFVNIDSYNHFEE